MNATPDEKSFLIDGQLYIVAQECIDSTNILDYHHPHKKLYALFDSSPKAHWSQYEYTKTTNDTTEPEPSRVLKVSSATIKRMIHEDPFGSFVIVHNVSSHAHDHLIDLQIIDVDEEPPRRYATMDFKSFAALLQRNGWDLDSYCRDHCGDTPVHLEFSSTVIIAYFSFAFMTLSTAALSHKEFYQQLSEEINGALLLILHTTICSLMLFSLRCRHRALYGFFECLFGILLVIFFFHPMGNQLEMLTQMIVAQMVVVRGLDNLSTGGMKKNRIWNRIFP